MSNKPSYLGMLNAIAVGEGRGCELFEAWSQATEDTDLKSVLDVIAIREAEHAAAFTKRICELGYSVRTTEDSQFTDNLALAGSDAPDRKKFKKLLGMGKKPAPEDRFPRLLKDASIDAATGSLLGRFIAEERDSGRMLRAACAALKNKPEGIAIDPVLAEISARINKLNDTLEELKTLR